MRITVIGKQHLKGVSKKTNNSYDFIQLYYNAPAQRVEGVAAKTMKDFQRQNYYDAWEMENAAYDTLAAEVTCANAT